MSVSNLAERTGNCKHWSARQMLENMIEAIDSGDIKPEQCVVHYFEPESDGGFLHGFFASGVSYAEHIALLNTALYYVVEKWRK